MAFDPPKTTGSNQAAEKIRILIVCAWPLGGIRTFLKYNYRHFPKDRFAITVLANPTIEKDSFEADLKAENIPVVWSEPWLGRNVLFGRVAGLLRHTRYDCIHSQGFTAAFHVAVVNHFPRVPHVLTMHGILEPKYFQGWSGPLKKFTFRRVLNNVTVFHAVGHDMLDHFTQEMPQLRAGHSRSVVIRNGIDIERFASPFPSARTELRKYLGCPPDTVVFGYFGRFMPEKGFDLLIKAAGILAGEGDSLRSWQVLAMGSGDYERQVRTEVHEAGLDKAVKFHPFSSRAADFIKGCDAVVVPSRHEAFPLLPCEALVAGIPVIASDAMGLREAVRDTPTLVFPVGDVGALASTMRSVIQDQSILTRFAEYKPKAADRYDVRRSAEQLVQLFQELTTSR